MKQSLEEARLELNRDYIDLFMLHEQESELTLQGHRPAVEYLQEAKSKGLIKAIGVSTHTVEVVWAAQKREELEVIHAIINYRGLGLAQGTLAELQEAIKAAYLAGKGLYGMKPLGGGNLREDPYTALNYAFRHPYLHSVALGCKIREEVDYALAVLEQREPSPQVIKGLDTTPRALHIEEWCQGCGTCVEKCPAQLLTVKNGRASLKSDGCVLCGYCGAVCRNLPLK
jgi:predicted aldo/keto reductase-like oxidoreductase